MPKCMRESHASEECGWAGNFQATPPPSLQRRGAVSSTSASPLVSPVSFICSPHLSFANHERQAAQSPEHEGRSREAGFFLLTSAACLFYSPGGLMIQYETQCAASVRRTQPQFHCTTVPLRPRSHLLAALEDSSSFLAQPARPSPRTKFCARARLHPAFRP